MAEGLRVVGLAFICEALSVPWLRFSYIKRFLSILRKNYEPMLDTRAAAAMARLPAVLRQEGLVDTQQEREVRLLPALKLPSDPLFIVEKQLLPRRAAR